MHLVIEALILALNLYFWVIIAWVMVSWLVVFDVLNKRNKWVNKFCALLERAVDPVMRPLRRFIPVLGGMDLTPMVVIFAIYFLLYVLGNLDVRI